VIIELEGLAPAAEEGWATLFDLNEADSSSSCLLVGGQMMHLLSVEHAAPVVRPTDDVDVVVDVRTRPQGTRWLADWTAVGRTLTLPPEQRVWRRSDS
jgi:hypothetical protein